MELNTRIICYYIGEFNSPLNLLIFYAFIVWQWTEIVELGCQAVGRCFDLTNYLEMMETFQFISNLDDSSWKFNSELTWGTFISFFSLRAFVAINNYI